MVDGFTSTSTKERKAIEEATIKIKTILFVINPRDPHVIEIMEHIEGRSEILRRIRLGLHGVVDTFGLDKVFGLSALIDEDDDVTVHRGQFLERVGGLALVVLLVEGNGQRQIIFWCLGEVVERFGWVLSILILFFDIHIGALLRITDDGEGFLGYVVLVDLVDGVEVGDEEFLRHLVGLAGLVWVGSVSGAFVDLHVKCFYLVQA